LPRTQGVLGHRTFSTEAETDSGKLGQIGDSKSIVIHKLVTFQHRHKNRVKSAEKLMLPALGRVMAGREEECVFCPLLGRRRAEVIHSFSKHLLIVPEEG
jgi:hypothetical protein